MARAPFIGIVAPCAILQRNNHTLIAMGQTIRLRIQSGAGFVGNPELNMNVASTMLLAPLARIPAVIRRSVRMDIGMVVQYRNLDTDLFVSPQYYVHSVSSVDGLYQLSHLNENLNIACINGDGSTTNQINAHSASYEPNIADYNGNTPSVLYGANRPFSARDQCGLVTEWTITGY